MAATSVLKLKVDDKEYNASLKQAQQGMQHLERALQDAGKSFTQVDKSIVNYVRSIGQMETQAKTARGKIGEMTNAFVELSMQYNKMSDEVKRSDVGKALSASMEQLKQRTQEAKRELQDLNKQLDGVGNAGAGGGGGLSGILGGKTDGMMAVFGGNLMTKGVMMAAGAVTSFVDEMGQAISQGVELAKQGEGIRMAFDRLGRGDILQGLREATHGTVTDIELMKAAVKFNDFKLPLDELGTMLAFAQQKAKDTGQSVDYMVDSIVTGLGRKSLMILDNLGLSANEIKEKMKETGDMTKAVGTIIREQMQSAGDYVETAADRATKADVELKNAMEELGRTFQPLTEASNGLWNSIKVGALNALNTAVKPLIDAMARAGALGEQARANAFYNQQGGDSFVDRLIKNLGSGQGKVALDLYKRQLANFDKAINDKRFQLAAFGDNNDSVIASNRNRVQGELDSIRKMREEYVRRAEELHNASKNPPKAPTTPTTTTTTTTPSRGGGGGSHVETAQEQAAKKVNAALASYAATIEKADMRMEAGLDTEADHKKKQLAAQERLYDAYTDAYTIYKDPSYKEASLNAAKEIERLTGEVKATTEAQDAAKKAAQQQEQAQKKLAEATDAAAKAMSQNDLKGFIAANRKVEGMGGTPSVIDPSAFTATSDNVDALLADLKNRIKEADLGSDLQLSLMAKMQDTTTLGQLIQNSIDESVQGADFSKAADAIMTAILSGDVPDDKIQDMLELINEKIREHGGLELEINAKGNVQRKADPRDRNPFLHQNEDGQYEAKLNDVLGGVASGMNQVVGGLEQLGIDVPEGIKNVLGGMQAISAILTGIATTILAIEAITAADAIIPFAQGGIVGHAAAGMLIPGNSLSGDRLRMPVDTGGYVGVNSGELILNKAQSNVIASALDGQGQQTNALQPYVDGEKIFLGMNNTSKRMGRGEIVTTGMLRKLGLMG